MVNSGIGGHQPQWFRGHSALMAAQCHRLRAIIGRPLTRGWLVWDLPGDEWFPDCPVLLDFDGEQIEVNHRKLDELSITWNTVDPRSPVAWPDFDLQWRHDKHPALHALHGQVLQDVELLEWTGNDLARGTVAVSFVFPDTQLTIFNALDQNGLALGSPDPQYRPHSLP